MPDEKRVDFNDPDTWVRYGLLYKGGTPGFYLPHQCEEWEIGDAGMMRRFIAACQAALDEVEERNDGSA